MCKYHPDVNKAKEAEEKFKEINAAYEIFKATKNSVEDHRSLVIICLAGRFQRFCARAGGSAGLDEILSQIFGARGNNSGPLMADLTSAGLAQEALAEIFELPRRASEYPYPILSFLMAGNTAYRFNGENIETYEKSRRHYATGKNIPSAWQGIKGAQCGDLILKVQVDSSPRYERWR